MCASTGARLLPKAFQVYKGLISLSRASKIAKSLDCQKLSLEAPKANNRAPPSPIHLSPSSIDPSQINISPFCLFRQLSSLLEPISDDGSLTPLNLPFGNPAFLFHCIRNNRNTGRKNPTHQPSILLEVDLQQQSDPAALHRRFGNILELWTGLDTVVYNQICRHSVGNPKIPLSLDHRTRIGTHPTTP